MIVHLGAATSHGVHDQDHPVCLQGWEQGLYLPEADRRERNFATNREDVVILDCQSLRCPKVCTPAELCDVLQELAVGPSFAGALVKHTAPLVNTVALLPRASQDGSRQLWLWESWKIVRGLSKCIHDPLCQKLWVRSEILVGFYFWPP